MTWIGFIVSILIVFLGIILGVFWKKIKTGLVKIPFFASKAARVIGIILLILSIGTAGFFLATGNFKRWVAAPFTAASMGPGGFDPGDGFGKTDGTDFNPEDFEGPDGSDPNTEGPGKPDESGSNTEGSGKPDESGSNTEGFGKPDESGSNTEGSDDKDFSEMPDRSDVSGNRPEMPDRRGDFGGRGIKPLGILLMVVEGISEIIFFAFVSAMICMFVRKARKPKMTNRNNVNEDGQQ